jgi:Ni,Fe-hydrogenase I small subunit
MPNSHPWISGQTLYEHLQQRGVSRRDFVRFCGEITAMLGLGSAVTPRILKAIQDVRRPSVIWLQLQECTGCVFFRLAFHRSELLR